MAKLLPTKYAELKTKYALSFLGRSRDCGADVIRSVARLGIEDDRDGAVVQQFDVHHGAEFAGGHRVAEGDGEFPPEGVIERPGELRARGLMERRAAALARAGIEGELADNECDRRPARRRFWVLRLGFGAGGREEGAKVGDPFRRIRAGNRRRGSGRTGPADTPTKSRSERFILPESSSKMRRAAVLAASQAASTGVSAWCTPRKMSKPGPISPVTRPATVTRAWRTRCRTARIQSKSGSSIQPRIARMTR